jgi:hypothetical protein
MWSQCQESPKKVQLIQHLDKLNETGQHTERGKFCPVFTEDSTGCLKCLCLGCKAVQGGSGRVSFRQVPGFDFDGKGPFQTMVALTQKHMANYISAGELVGMKHAQEIVCPDGTISLMQDTPGLASSVVVAKKVAGSTCRLGFVLLRADSPHSPRSGQGPGNCPLSNGQSHSGLLCVWGFGSCCGHAHPTYVHSISSRCQPWEFYSSSLYTKTAVIAGNVKNSPLKIEGRTYAEKHGIY